MEGDREDLSLDKKDLDVIKTPEKSKYSCSGCSFLRQAYDYNR